MSGAWHIAQLNIATALFPLDDPRMADFVEQLDQINALAEASPGFVWRLKGDGGDATSVRVNDDPQLIVNMSVWTGIDALFDFVYRSAHRDVFAQRREWFERPVQGYQVLWWVGRGHRPTPDEGMARLALLNRLGPTDEAFSFKQRFAPA